MEEIKLSIIIPVYNLEKYISECLDSIIEQIEKNIEIVIVNDGSKDGSDSICKKYQEKYNFIRYLYQENLGVSSARNNGLKEARGRYIWFIDGDDWILPTSLSNITNYINSDKKFDIVIGDFVKSYGQKIDIVGKLNSKVIKNINNEQYPRNLIDIFKNNIFNPSLCCNIFKRELFINNNILLDESVKYTEDMDCVLRLFLKSTKFVILEKPIYVYRQSREGSATNKVSLKRVEDNFNFVKSWLGILDKDLENKELKVLIEYFLKYEYSIVVGMLFLLSKSDYELIGNDIKEYEYLLKGGSGIKGKLVNMTYKLFGFYNTGKLMGLWIKR